MQTSYQIFHNMTAAWLRTYKQGDTIIAGHSGETHVWGTDDPSNNLENIWQCLDNLFWLHNHDERPDAATAPALSVGDVIAVGGNAYSVDRQGFALVQVDHRDIIHVPYHHYRIGLRNTDARS